MKPLKIHLHTGHSAGRGVGFYAQNLKQAFSHFPQVKFTSQNPDLIHYPFFDLFYSTLPFKKIAPTIVTIHDLTPLVLSHLYPKGLKGTLNLLRQRLALINVSAILTDSQASRIDLINIFRLPARKIHVTPLAHDPIFDQPVSQTKLTQVKKKYHLPDRFVLSVPGGPNPNKNLPALAQATQDLNIPLVIVGGGMTQDLPLGPIHPELRGLARLKEYNHLIFPGFVSTPDLVAIYKLASLYCQPSLYEGFGIPLLEAQAVGCLLVSSNTSSLPELYPPGTLNFDPTNLKQMQKTLAQALKLPFKKKQKFITAGRKFAARFTWDKTARLTLKVYQQVLHT